MRRNLLALLCALILMTLAASPCAAALEGEPLRAADTLATLGIVRGGYALESPATRAQAAAVLVRLAGAENDAETDLWISGFRDVPTWAERAVTYAAHRGWVNGVTQVAFRPNDAVTANAWCAFLLRMLGYGDEDFAVSGAAVFAQRIGLTARAYSGPLTRGELFEIAAGALTFPYKDGGATVAEHLIANGACPQAAVRALGLLDETLTARQAADRCMSAVFRLELYENQLEIDAGMPGAVASGFFISADGLAVTNHHSIDGYLRADAILSTGETRRVEKVLWSDPGADLAVVRVAPVRGGFACLELAGVGDLRPGDVVYALGNPLGQGLSVSEGVVSAVDREITRYDRPCVVSTADISHGSSGGALLNVYGHAVAVTSGAYANGNSMYLSVPVDPLFTADLTGPGKTLAELKASK